MFLKLFYDKFLRNLQKHSKQLNVKSMRKRFFTLMLIVLSAVGYMSARQEFSSGKMNLKNNDADASLFDFTQTLKGRKCIPSKAVGPEHPNYVTTQPEGELRYYVRDGAGYTSFLGGTEEVIEENLVQKIVFDPDNRTVWFYEIIGSADYCFGWIHGEIEGNIIRVPGGQYAWYYNYGEYETAYTVKLVQINPDGELNGYNYLKCVDGDIIFSISDDGSIRLVNQDDNVGIGLCVESTDPFMIENGMAVRWLGYADTEAVMTPIDLKTCDGPSEGTETEKYFVRYEGSLLDGPNGMEMVNVAVTDEEIYIQGLMPAYFGKSWIKGNIKGDKVEFESGIFAGCLQRHYIFYVAGYVDDKDTFNYLPTYSMGYDPEKKQLTFPDWILMNAYPDERLLYCDGLFNIEMHPFVDAPVSPANPIVGEEYMPYGEYGDSMSVSFQIIPEGKDGEDIDPQQLFYEVYVDGQLFTFDPSIYFTFWEPVSVLPFGFADYFFIEPSETTPNTVMISFFNPEFKTFGARSIYYGGGEERCSEIVTFDPHGGNGLKEMNDYNTDPLYYDLQGQLLLSPQKGMVIEVIHNTDGTVKTKKMMVK